MVIERSGLMWGTLRLSIAVGACLSLSACGSAPSPTATAPTPPAPPSAATTAPPPASTSLAPPSDATSDPSPIPSLTASSPTPPGTDDSGAPTPVALLPADVPPEGVADLLGGALPYIADPCRKLAEDLGAAAARTPLVVPRPIEVGTTDSICLFGYPADHAVPVTVWVPDGTVRELAVEIVDDALSGTVVGSLRWTAFPGDAVGAYTIAAVGPDGLRTTATLEIAAATAPHVIADPAEVAAGEELRIGVAGFPPGQPLPIHVYLLHPSGAAERPWRYLTTLGPLTPDASGVAALRVDVPTGAEATDYALVPGEGVADYRTIASSDFRVVP